jgi:uncharacterized protein YndB with AHSA1/START domain
MIGRIASIVCVLVLAFVIFVNLRPGTFRVERSAIIKAPPEALFPYLSELKLGTKWSPYEDDPETKRIYVGTDGKPGASEDFEGKKYGSGKVKLLEVNQNRRVVLSLSMREPIAAENLIEYQLKPAENGTEFKWIMVGHNSFVGKLFGLVVNVDKMVGDQFMTGIDNLKRLVEAKKPQAPATNAE